MRTGFHTISFLLHDEVTAIDQLAQLGYAAVAIRPRLSGIHLRALNFDDQVDAIARIVSQHALQLVLDLSGMFLDDPMKESSVSLASNSQAESAAAAESVSQWIKASEKLGANVISISSGQTVDSDSRSTGRDFVKAESVDSLEADFERFAETLSPLIEQATRAGVELAIRPVTSDLIGSVAQYERFLQWLGSDGSISVAPDVGEMLRSGEFPVGERLARHRHRLGCVYLCQPDLERGRDQRFGRGDIDLSRVWSSIAASGFDGPAIFRVFGHSEVGLPLAQEALAVMEAAS